MKIAITGNIGSGKSEAIKFLSSLGYKCISSDQIIKSLYQNDQSRNYILKRMGVTNKNYKEEIIKRDNIDSTRKIAPLLKAEDAFEIDVSYLTIDQVFNKLIEIIKN